MEQTASHLVSFLSIFDEPRLYDPWLRVITDLTAFKRREKEMIVHHIKLTTGDVVASDTAASVLAIDNAVLAQARLTASVIEGAQDSKLAITATQKLLQSMTNGMSVLVSSRAELTEAVREINVIQMRSNLKTTSFGCPERPAGADKLVPVRSENA